LTSVDRLARRYPDATVVIDHLGRPDLAQRRNRDALASLMTLAQRPNVLVKASAIDLLSRRPPPHKDTWPWLRAVADAFGPHRMMWGSNYPWVLERGSIDASLGAVRTALATFTPAEVSAVLDGTARRVFGFEADESTPTE
jgi:L-fuconolactonase